MKFLRPFFPCQDSKIFELVFLNIRNELESSNATWCVKLDSPYMFAKNRQTPLDFPLFQDAMIVVYLTLLLQFKALLNCMQVFIYSVRAKIECMKKKLSLELDCFSEVVFTQVVELWCEHVLDFFLQPRVGIYEREKRF